MQLELHNVSRYVEGEMHLADISLVLETGSLNVLLGPTLSGKTSLMRLMAGLDRVNSGAILVDGKDVSDVAVQKRNVAMVYQQFINYPNLSVYDNIASPLKIAKVPAQEIKKRVSKMAALLKLENMLQRSPNELSGGQQQRTALARALVKDAELVLLDEPLANLDYKLREELREELPKIFAETGAIFVYATTEPSEALLLGGNTATLHEGRLTQFGETLTVFSNPHNLLTAQTISDPPLNVAQVTIADGVVSCGDDLRFSATEKMNGLKAGSYTLAFRPYQVSLQQSADTEDIAITGKVAVAEITGAESYIHIDVEGMRWVVLTSGIHNFSINQALTVFLNPTNCFIFAEDGQLMITPEESTASHGGVAYG